MNLVISQSMLFPWLGFIQLVAGADMYVRYDDVKYSKGSFTNRVQIRTSSGKTWITVPVVGSTSRTIDEIDLIDIERIATRIRSQVLENYRLAPHLEDALAILNETFATEPVTLGELSFRSTLAILGYLGLSSRIEFVDVASLNLGGRSSDRVLDVCMKLGASRYSSAMGGLTYLDHDKFATNGVEVLYPKYDLTPWPQCQGGFDPYVSALDVIANCGSGSRSMLDIDFIPWKHLVDGSD